MAVIEHPMVSFWNGQDIREMTRAELIAALEECGCMYLKAMEAHHKELREWKP